MSIRTFETERLRLRPLRYDDAEHIYQLGRNPIVMRHITGGKTQTRDESRRDLERRIQISGREYGYWIVETREQQIFLGWLALKQLAGTNDIEIGYRFLQEHWGKGYATEASHRLLRYAFQDLGLRRVVSVAKEENLASTRVMTKLGMQLDHVGYYYDTRCVFYQIYREDFQQRSIAAPPSGQRTPNKG